MICPIHSYFGKSLQEGLGTYMSLASPVPLPYRSERQNSKSRSQCSVKHHKLSSCGTSGHFSQQKWAKLPTLLSNIPSERQLSRHLSAYPKMRCHKAVSPALQEEKLQTSKSRYFSGMQGDRDSTALPGTERSASNTPTHSTWLDVRTKKGRGTGVSAELGHSSSDMSARLSRKPPPATAK